MDKYDIISKIEELADLKHRAEIKHINADRMGESYLRKKGYELDEKFEAETDKFASDLVDRMKTKV